MIHRCYDCGKEREVQTRYQHAARLLCDGCSSKRGPGRAPLPADPAWAPQNRQWTYAELDAFVAEREAA